MMEEAYVGLIRANLPNINQVFVVDFWAYNFILVMSKNILMVMREVDLCIRLTTLPTITPTGVIYCWVDLLFNATLKRV